jgi:hypothetical protein|nr:MAG TPA: Protein of unknown function (DUF1043) [Caudoviricetes sp.]
MKILKKINIELLIVFLIGCILGNLTIIKEFWMKNLELRGVILTLFGTILGILITNSVNSKNLEKEQKFREKLEEKKFLKGKLEIIVDEMFAYELEAKEAIKKSEIGSFDRGEKYKKAFYLSHMYFPELRGIINRYDLSVNPRGFFERGSGDTRRIENLFSRPEEYNNFLKQIPVELERINNI